VVRDDTSRPESAEISCEEGQRAVQDVKNLAIWGNHSATQFTRLWQRHDQREKGDGLITDLGWLQGDFLRRCQKRGAAVIEARASVRPPVRRTPAIDTVAQLVTATTSDDCVSVAVTSHGDTAFPKD